MRGYQDEPKEKKPKGSIFKRVKVKAPAKAKETPLKILGAGKKPKLS